MVGCSRKLISPFPPTNSLHTAITMRLKLPSCLFVAISFVQHIALFSAVCSSWISVRHSILSTIPFYCLCSIGDSLSLTQLLTDVSFTLSTVHNLSSLLVTRQFRLLLTDVCYMARLKVRSSFSAMQKTSAPPSTTTVFSIVYSLTTCKFTSTVLSTL
jgi:hypothetical protein